MGRCIRNWWVDLLRGDARAYFYLNAFAKSSLFMPRFMETANIFGGF